jgi:(2Fe-2S) ferredoxin
MAIKNITLVKKHLFICNGGTCKINGAEESTVALRNAINKAGLQDEIHTTKTLCNGRCKDGPVVIAMPDGIWFKQMVASVAEIFVEDYLINNMAPEKNVLYQYGEDFINAVEAVFDEEIKP